MSLRTKVGNFQLPTGAAGTTLAITGVGFQPTIVFFMWNGQTVGIDATSNAQDARLGFGVAISTTDRRCYTTYSQHAANPSATATGHRADSCIGVIKDATPTWDGWMDLSSLDSDGFTIKVGQQLASGTQYRIQYLALGSIEQTVKTGSFTKNSTAGQQSVTGIGFRPEAIILLGGHPLLTAAEPDIQLGAVFGMGLGAQKTGSQTVQQAGMSGSAKTGQATTSCKRVGELGMLGGEWTSAINTLALITTLVSLDADGFTLNYGSPGTAIVMDYIVLKGGNYNIVETQAVLDTTTSQNAGGFIECGGLHICAQQTSDATTVANSSLLALGCNDTQINQQSVCAADVNAQTGTSIVLGLSVSDFINLVKPTNAFEQRTNITSFDPVGAFAFINQSAPAGTNLTWSLLFGAEWNETGAFTAK